MPPKVVERKICVMGYRGVGKSTVTIQFVENQFIDNYNPTIEDTFQKTIHHKGVDYSCTIIDTAGQVRNAKKKKKDDFSLFQKHHSIGIHGYIFVYSITSVKSLETVKTINDKLLNALGTQKVPRVLVGNKTDLHLERKVTKEEVQRLAAEWGCAFVECSGKHGEHIQDIFFSILDEIEKEQAPQEDPKAGQCILV
jgi:Ras family protein